MTKISNVNNSKEVDSYDLQNVKNIETSIVQRSKCQEFQNFKGTKVDHGPEMQKSIKGQECKGPTEVECHHQGIIHYCSCFLCHSKSVISSV